MPASSSLQALDRVQAGLCWRWHPASPDDPGVTGPQSFWVGAGTRCEKPAGANTGLTVCISWRGEGRQEGHQVSEWGTMTLAGELHFQRAGGEHTNARDGRGVPGACCAGGITEGKTQRVLSAVFSESLSGLFRENQRSNNNKG